MRFTFLRCAQSATSAPLPSVVAAALPSVTQQSICLIDTLEIRAMSAGVVSMLTPEISSGRSSESASWIAVMIRASALPVRAVTASAFIGGSGVTARSARATKREKSQPAASRTTVTRMTSVRRTISHGVSSYQMDRVSKPFWPQNRTLALDHVRKGPHHGHLCGDHGGGPRNQRSEAQNKPVRQR